MTKCIGLRDAREANKKHPETFHIPSEEDIRALKPGDQVKLQFLTDSEEWVCERMWVTIETIEGDDFTGVLDNDPAVITEGLKYADPVKFEARHVCTVM